MKHLGIGGMFDLLPSREGYEKDILIEEAPSIGIHPCGDSDRGNIIYKLLTREGVMITYKEKGGILYYQKTSFLNPFK